MNLPRPVIALVLIAAFLLHDGWMAHAGHIIYDDVTHPAEESHHHEDMVSTTAIVPADAVITPETSMPISGHDHCMVLRIGAPNPVPGIALTSSVVAILPMPVTPAGGSKHLQSTVFTEPGKSAPPDVRRALIQVFLI
ncbi:MAG: hypothetical protein ACTHQE_08865 [Thermomicrobiales bacterium]